VPRRQAARTLGYSLIQLRGCQANKNTAARNQYAPIREQRRGVSRAPDLHPTGNAERASRRVVNLRGGIFVASDIPSITLPSTFEFGDSFLTQDMRLSRDFSLHERWRITLIGEVFNLFNIGNLSGRSGDLLNPGFGQATSRVTQVFGSGGPRSFQLAARVSF